MDNISLEFKKEALDFIVQKAVEYKLGARVYARFVKKYLLMLCFLYWQ